MFAEQFQQESSFISSVFPLVLSNARSHPESLKVKSLPTKARLCSLASRTRTAIYVDKIQVQESVSSRQLGSVVRMLRKARSKQKASDRIQAFMLSYPGAFVPRLSTNQRYSVDKMAPETRTTYFLEIDEENQDTIFLCRSCFLVSSPLETWYSERVIGLKTHALARMFERGLVLSSSDKPCLKALACYLLEISGAHQAYIARHSAEASSLVEQGWCISITQDKARAILSYEDKLPVVLTIAKSTIAAGENARAEMLPSKTMLRKPRLYMELGRV